MLLPEIDEPTRLAVRNPSDELAVSEGCRFIPEFADRPIRFLERFCRQSQGKWAGKPLKILPWQAEFLRPLYGWRRPDGTRRFRTAYLEVPKKQGKSTLLSGLGLEHIVAGREPAAEVYICAVDRSQAGIIYGEAARMVAKSPDLSSRLEAIPSKKTIVFAANESKLEALSADVPSKDGLNASLVLFDELHRQPNSAMYDIMRYAGAAREQPLHIDITTAGEDEAGVWFDRRLHSEQVNAGLREDTSHLGVIYRADKDDDFESPEVWRKANPSLGVILSEDAFGRELKEAQRSDIAWANFLRLRLGVVISTSIRFVNPVAWAACTGEPIDPDSLIGRPCFGGLDLSMTTDLSAYVLIFPDERDGWIVLCRAWCPEERAIDREREQNTPYRMWSQRGFISLNPGNVIDYTWIEDQIVEDASKYRIQKLLADQWNATHLCVSLQNRGIPVEFLGQRFSDLTGATKELERRILLGRIRHGGNPLLSWAAGNAITEQDSNGNIKLSKKKSKDRIDPMAALVNATAASMSDVAPQAEPRIRFI
jgi:phage terminase large subunit-like protein